MLQELPAILVAGAAVAGRIRRSFGEEPGQIVFRVALEDLDEDRLCVVAAELGLERLQVVSQDIGEALALFPRVSSRAGAR